MNEHVGTDEGGVTRRDLLTGLGVATTAAGLLAALPNGTAVLAAPAQEDVTEALAALQPGLTYLPFDAYAFFNETTTNGRQVDELTGANPVNPAPGGTLVTPLLIPAGSVIRQINVAYRGNPGVFIWSRPMNNPTVEQAFINETLPASGGAPRAETVATNFTIQQNTTYTLRFTCSAGTSIHGATVGYQPPTQGFRPLATITRPVDTRQPLGGGKLAANEERTYNLDLPLGSRGAVINLTIADTEGPSGYVAVFPAGVSWPGNSSINWSSPGSIAANTVITATTNGQIKVRGGENPTHIIIDVLGSLQ